MSSEADGFAVEGRVHIVLKASVAQLTDHELQRISQIAEQSHAQAHISQGPWQLLLDVPEERQQFAVKSLRSLDYHYFSYDELFNTPPIFVLNREAAEELLAQLASIYVIRMENSGGEPCRAN